MFTSIGLAAALGAWAAVGAFRGFYGEATTYPALPRDEFQHVAPPYYPRLPNRPATELSPAYGRYGGYPLLHGRNLRGPRMFVQGYRGYSYRGGNF